MQARTEVGLLIEQVVRLMVNDGASIQLSEDAEPTGITFTLKVANVDMGRLLGRQGRTARALRTILGAMAARAEQRYTLIIAE